MEIICPKLQVLCEDLYFKKTTSRTGNPSVIIPEVRSDIFDFDYPIFDENYRSILEIKIIRKYYFRRLCCESYMKWKVFLESNMNEIMPLFNQYYESATLELNPLYNFIIDVKHEDSGGDKLVSTTEKSEDNSTGNTTQNERVIERGGDNKTTANKTGADTTTSKNSSENVSKYNDTPQGRLNEIKNGTYLTEATIDDNTSTGENKTKYGSKVVELTEHNTVDNDKLKQVVTGKNVLIGNSKKKEALTTDRQYVEKVMGRKEKSDAELLMKFRETFINVDAMIMDELANLFEGRYYPCDF